MELHKGRGEEVKRIPPVLCAAAALFALQASAAAAPEKPGTRVLVIPFDDPKLAYKDSDRTLTEAAIEAVKGADKFTYVSPDTFAKNWTKVLTDNERKLFKGDPETEMKDLRRYRSVFVHEDLGTIAEYRDRWGADLVVIGRVVEPPPESEDPPTLLSEIISIGTGRLYSVEKPFDPDAAAKIMKKEVAMLLAKGDAVQKVDADGVLNPSRSTVGYDVKATDGQYLRIVFDYSSERPDPVIQRIDIVPHRPVKDGILQLKVQTKEKKPIKFQYYFKNGQFVNIKISTEPPPPAAPAAKGPAAGPKTDKAEKPDEETLTAKSVGGYAIKFTFSWKDGEIKGVRAEPAVNPYGAIK
jgi:hypothetical protein